MDFKILFDFKSEQDMRRSLAYMLLTNGLFAYQEERLPNGRRIDIFVHSHGYKCKYTLLVECKLILSAANVSYAHSQLISYSQFHPDAGLAIAGMSAERMGMGPQAQLNAADEIRFAEKNGLVVWQLDKWDAFCRWAYQQGREQGWEKYLPPKPKGLEFLRMTRLPGMATLTPQPEDSICPGPKDFGYIPRA